jgi:Acetyltransferase (GNAT) domain
MTHEAVMPEICYEVFPAYRRQGYAREAVLAMFGWSQDDPAVLRFRATGSPENLASRFARRTRVHRGRQPVGRGGRPADHARAVRRSDLMATHPGSEPPS